MQQLLIAEDTTLYEHLHKLVALKSEQELESLLALLWQTRKIGLSASQKSSLQSRLRLTHLVDLDPVLACLRSLLIKCLRENFDADDILKLLPADLTLELQSMLLVTLQKHQNQWKGRTGLPASILSISSPEVSCSFLPQQVPVPQFNNYILGGPTSVDAERNILGLPRLTLQNDAFRSDNLGVLPWLKSMTWTVENKSTVLANRVAIISLKLQNCTKPPSVEMEVKFQLTRDTLEAVLTSMTYINAQLSRLVRPSSMPLQKKQRQ